MKLIFNANIDYFNNKTTKSPTTYW